MQQYEFNIPGIPISWKRARHNKKRYFDPQHKEKEAVRLQVISNLLLMGDHPFPINYPHHVLFQFYFPFPKNTPQKRRFPSPYTGTKDLSNLIKFYEDALNGMLWEDDRYIVSYLPPAGCTAPIYPQKMQCAEPHTFITVWTR